MCGGRHWKVFEFSRSNDGFELRVKGKGNAKGENEREMLKTEAGGLVNKLDVG